MAPSAFADIAQTHEEFRSIVRRHQLALLAGDLAQARERFLDLMEDIRRHGQEEDEVLIPLYRDRAHPSPGGDWRNFTGEHEKIRLFMARIWQKIEEAPNAPDRAVAILAILDDEARFKDLLDHHFKREEMFLFPELDRIVPDEEKSSLLNRFTFHYL